MNLGTTIEYLYEMETNNYLMTRELNSLKNKSKYLAIKPRVASPTERKDFVREELGKANYSDAQETISFICIFVGVVIGIIASISFWHGDHWLITKLFVTAVEMAIYGFIGFLIGYLVLSNIYILIKRSQYKSEANSEYDIKVNEYRNNVKNSNQRYEIEKKQKQIIDEECRLLSKKLSESKELLQEMYYASGIYSAYWNIVPMGYMYEFYRLGISRRLEGADGLYYLVRKELRYDSFNYSLNEISSKLDTLIDQNKEIYRELQSLNRKCDYNIQQTMKNAEIAASNNRLLKTAVANSSIAAYNSERIKREVIISNYFLR